MLQSSQELNTNQLKNWGGEKRLLEMHCDSKADRQGRKIHDVKTS